MTATFSCPQLYHNPGGRARGSPLVRGGRPGVRGVGPGREGDGGAEGKVADVVADGGGEDAGLVPPAGEALVPIGEGAVGQAEDEALALAGPEADLPEGREGARGARDGGAEGRLKVDLGDGGAGAVGGVLDGDAEGDAVFADRDVGVVVGEGGVGEAVAEGKGGDEALGVEPAVADEDVLAVVGDVRGIVPKGVGGAVQEAPGPGVDEAAGGLAPAEKDVREGVAARLPEEGVVEEGVGAVEPGEAEGRAALEEDEGARVGGQEVWDGGVVLWREVKVGAVGALALTGGAVALEVARGEDDEIRGAGLLKELGEADALLGGPEPAEAEGGVAAGLAVFEGQGVDMAPAERADGGEGARGAVLPGVDEGFAVEEKPEPVVDGGDEAVGAGLGGAEAGAPADGEGRVCADLREGGGAGEALGGGRAAEGVVVEALPEPAALEGAGVGGGVRVFGEEAGVRDGRGGGGQGGEGGVADVGVGEGTAEALEEGGLVGGACPRRSIPRGSAGCPRRRRRRGRCGALPGGGGGARRRS